MGNRREAEKVIYDVGIEGFLRQQQQQLRLLFPSKLG
jgi:hypothetical protein